MVTRRKLAKRVKSPAYAATLADSDIQLARTKIAVLVKVCPELAGIFQAHGIDCMGCNVLPVETLDGMIQCNNLDAGQFLTDVKAALSLVPQFKISG